MKGTLIAIITLFTVLALVITNSIILHILIDKIISDVDGVIISEPNTASDSFSKCYERFKIYESYISLTVSHRDLTDINDAFRTIIAAGEVGDTDEMIITKNRLKGSLEHLRRLSGINLDSILFINGHILGVRALAHHRIIFV